MRRGGGVWVSFSATLPCDSCHRWRRRASTSYAGLKRGPGRLGSRRSLSRAGIRVLARARAPERRQIRCSSKRRFAAEPFLMGQSPASVSLRALGRNGRANVPPPREALFPISPSPFPTHPFSSREVFALSLCFSGVRRAELFRKPRCLAGCRARIERERE